MPKWLTVRAKLFQHQNSIEARVSIVVCAVAGSRKRATHRKLYAKWNICKNPSLVGPGRSNGVQGIAWCRHQVCFGHDMKRTSFYVGGSEWNQPWKVSICLHLFDKKNLEPLKLTLNICSGPRFDGRHVYMERRDLSMKYAATQRCKLPHNMGFNKYAMLRYNQITQ